MKTDRIIRQYLWLTGAFNFGASISLATYVAFLISRGLNLFEVNLVNVTFFTAMFFAEIPTGVFADTFGRKKSYVISCFLFSIGELAYSQATGMFGCIFAEVLAGVGRTFANGAYHAWLVDSLRHHGYEGSTQPVFRKEQMVRQFVSVPGAIFGSYIGSYDLAYPWIVGAIFGVISGLAALIVMKEEYFATKKASIIESTKEMIDIGKKGMVFSWQSPVVRFIIFAGVIMSFSSQALNMQWQPFFGNVVATKHFGYIWAGISTCVFLGMHFSLKLARLFSSERSAMLFCCGIAGVGMVLAALTKHYIAVSLAMFLIHEIPRGAIIPIKDGYLNDNTNQRERATVISCQSTFTHLACLSGLLASGLIAQQISISAAWVVSGVVLVSASLWLARR